MTSVLHRDSGFRICDRTRLLERITFAMPQPRQHNQRTECASFVHAIEALVTTKQQHSDEIEKFQRLRDKRIITDAEFNDQTAWLLKRQGNVTRKGKESLGAPTLLRLGCLPDSLDHRNTANAFPAM